MTTPILQNDELENQQVNQYIVANTALRNLEAAANDVLLVDVSAADATVTNTSTDNYAMLRHFLFRSEGNAITRTITFSPNKRSFAVHNNGTATLSVAIGTTSLTIPIGEAHRFYADGSANGLIRLI